MQMASENMVLRTKSPVYSTHELVDNLSEVLVFFDISTTGDRNLDKDDLANPFGMVVEENLKGVQLLGDTFDVVQTVNTDDELNALELLLELSDPVLDGSFVQALRKLLGIDSYRESADCSKLSLELDTVWCRGQPSASS